MNVGRVQRICCSLSFEIYLSNISIIKLVYNLCWGTFSRSRSMSWFCFCSFNICNIHYISCTNIKLFFLCWASSFDIINILLISYEFQRFRINIFNALKFIWRIERVSTNPCSCKFDTLWLCPFNVFNFQLIIWLIG